LWHMTVAVVIDKPKEKPDEPQHVLVTQRLPQSIRDKVVETIEGGRFNPVVGHLEVGEKDADGAIRLLDERVGLSAEFKDKHPIRAGQGTNDIQRRVVSLYRNSDPRYPNNEIRVLFEWTPTSDQWQEIAKEIKKEQEKRRDMTKKEFDDKTLEEFDQERQAGKLPSYAWLYSVPKEALFKAVLDGDPESQATLNKEISDEFVGGERPEKHFEATQDLFVHVLRDLRAMEEEKKSRFVIEPQIESSSGAAYWGQRYIKWFAGLESLVLLASVMLMPDAFARLAYASLFLAIHIPRHLIRKDKVLWSDEVLALTAAKFALGALAPVMSLANPLTSMMVAAVTIGHYWLNNQSTSVGFEPNTSSWRWDRRAA
jgi:hypothetical protein